MYKLIHFHICVPIVIKEIGIVNLREVWGDNGLKGRKRRRSDKIII